MTRLADRQMRPRWMENADVLRQSTAARAVLVLLCCVASGCGRQCARGSLSGDSSRWLAEAGGNRTPPLPPLQGIRGQESMLYGAPLSVRVTPFTPLCHHVRAQNAHISGRGQCIRRGAFRCGNRATVHDSVPLIPRRGAPRVLVRLVRLRVPAVPESFPARRAEGGLAPPACFGRVGHFGAAAAARLHGADYCFFSGGSGGTLDDLGARFSRATSTAVCIASTLF
jgi:hypothetical protein